MSAGPNRDDSCDERADFRICKSLFALDVRGDFKALSAHVSAAFTPATRKPHA
jgi:hypothetical protein